MRWSPPPPGLIGLTCNELQHLFAALVIQRAADTKPAPAPATTDDKPPPGTDEDCLPAVPGGQGANAHLQQHIAPLPGAPLARQQLPALRLKNPLKRQGL